MVHQKPFNLSNRYCVLGLGKGIVFIVLFSSLKSEINVTLPFVLGIIKVEVAHYELLIIFNFLILTHVSTSFLRVGL